MADQVLLLSPSVKVVPPSRAAIHGASLLKGTLAAHLHLNTDVLLLLLRLLTLEHGSERVVCRCVLKRNRLARAPALFGIGLAVAEGETNEEAFAHLVLAVGHGLESLLLLMHLLVLGHVSLVAEIVKVTSIRLRVQLGDEGRLGLAQRRPVHLGEVLVLINVLDVREPTGAGVDAPRVS